MPNNFNLSKFMAGKLQVIFENAEAYCQFISFIKRKRLNLHIFSNFEDPKLNTDTFPPYRSTHNSFTPSENCIKALVTKEDNTISENPNMRVLSKRPYKSDPGIETYFWDYDYNNADEFSEDEQVEVPSINVGDIVTVRDLLTSEMMTAFVTRVYQNAFHCVSVIGDLSRKCKKWKRFKSVNGEAQGYYIKFNSESQQFSFKVLKSCKVDTFEISKSTTTSQISNDVLVCPLGKCEKKSIIQVYYSPLEIVDNFGRSISVFYSMIDRQYGAGFITKTPTCDSEMIRHSKDAIIEARICKLENLSTRRR